MCQAARKLRGFKAQHAGSVRTQGQAVFAGGMTFSHFRAVSATGGGEGKDEAALSSGKDDAFIAADAAQRAAQFLRPANRAIR